MKASYRMIILALALMGGALATYLSVQAMDEDTVYDEDLDDHLEYDDDEEFFDDEDDLGNEDSANDFLDNDDL